MKKTSKKQSKTQESTNLVVGDIVLYLEDIIDKTENFKIVEILDDKLHIAELRPRRLRRRALNEMLCTNLEKL